MQIVILFLFGDSAVKDTVDKARNGSHWCFKFMRDVSDKAPADIFGGRKRLSHVVEGTCKIAHFIIACHVDTYTEVSFTELFSSLRHLFKRFDEIIREDAYRKYGDRECCNSGKDEYSHDHVRKRSHVICT